MENSNKELTQTEIQPIYRYEDRGPGMGKYRVEKDHNIDLGIWGIFTLVILVVVTLALFVFWLMMLVNIIKRPMDGIQKVLWFLLLLVVGLIGAVVYYFAVYRNKSISPKASIEEMITDKPKV